MIILHIRHYTKFTYLADLDKLSYVLNDIITIDNLENNNTHINKRPFFIFHFQLLFSLSTKFPVLIRAFMVFCNSKIYGKFLIALLRRAKTFYLWVCKFYMSWAYFGYLICQHNRQNATKYFVVSTFVYCSLYYVLEKSKQDIKNCKITRSTAIYYWFKIKKTHSQKMI